MPGLTGGKNIGIKYYKKLANLIRLWSYKRVAYEYEVEDVYNENVKLYLQSANIAFYNIIA